MDGAASCSIAESRLELLGLTGFVCRDRFPRQSHNRLTSNPTETKAPSGVLQGAMTLVDAVALLLWQRTTEGDPASKPETNQLVRRFYDEDATEEVRTKALMRVLGSQPDILSKLTTTCALYLPRLARPGAMLNLLAETKAAATSSHR